MIEDLEIESLPRRTPIRVRFPFHAIVASLVLVIGVVMPQALKAQQMSPYGILVNQIDHTTPQGTISTHMQKVTEAGAGWVRADFFWYSVQWSPGQWDWHYFDYVVNEATSRGLGIIPVLWGTPYWAKATGDNTVWTSDNAYQPPNLAAWDEFVFQTVTRYKDRIRVWEIWNEPDGPWYWNGTPSQYAELLGHAFNVIRSADPTATVLLGGLAQGGTGVTSDFLQQILADPQYPAGYYFDGHNIHTNFRTMTDIASQLANNASILTSYGFTKPIVVTESSYSSDPAYQSLPGYGGGEDGQSRYILDAYAAILANGATLAVWASAKDFNGTGEYAQSGLLRTDLSAKLAFTAYQQMTQPAPVPVSPLVISNVTASGKASKVTIQWTTNLSSNSIVEYGPTPTLTTTVTKSTLTTSHAVTLSGIKRRTAYSFFVTSTTADGSTASSQILTFVIK